MLADIGKGARNMVREFMPHANLRPHRHQPGLRTGIAVVEIEESLGVGDGHPTTIGIERFGELYPLAQPPYGRPDALLKPLFEPRAQRDGSG